MLAAAMEKGELTGGLVGQARRTFWGRTKGKRACVRGAGEAGVSTTLKYGCGSSSIVASRLDARGSERTHPELGIVACHRRLFRGHAKTARRGRASKCIAQSCVAHCVGRAASPTTGKKLDFGLEAP